MLKSVLRWLLLGFSLTQSAQLFSQDFSSLTAQFAARITQHSPAGAVSVSVVNRSSLSSQDVATIRSELLQQLQARGWRAKTSDQDSGSIAVVLSESARDYVWTAEITGLNSKDVAVIAWPKPRQHPAVATDVVTLTRTLLISSDDALLDVALLDGKINDGSRLLALTSSAVQLYQMQGGQWRAMQAQPLGREPRPARDLRGEIVAGQGSSFDAYLPGLHCNGVATSTISIVCRESDDPWPLSADRRLLAFYAASRNYFTGVLSGPANQTGNADPFYSAAILNNGAIYAGIDGRARLAFSGQPASIIPYSWGSSVAAVRGGCIPDLVLASSRSDFDHGDSVTAFRLAGSQLTQTAEPLSFSGPVMNLAGSTDGQQAIAVVASPPGRNEAYLLTARCGS